ncbi:MAG: alpha-L-fucosidase [Chloroflexia bacterium]|nr:alpha-L-fucosidase [Chloroflexia bacterium]
MGFGNTGWFTNDRFGMFIHWGLYALPGRHEWVKKREQITTEDYQKYIDHFEPDLYDPKQWAADAKAAGMKYAVITSKHHEGFCLWDSQLTDYKVTNTPIGRDLLAEWVEAFRAEGLKVGFYHSVIDWHHPEFAVDNIHPQSEDQAFREREKNRDQQKYADYLHGQTRELLTNYGKIDILWYDFTGPEKSKADWRSEELVTMVRELQPDIILNDRIGYPESADFVTPEQYQPKETPTRDGQKVVWEACQTLNGSWGYDRDNLDWKSPELLVKMLVDSVAKGGNVLLNVGPTGRGEFDSRARASLAAIGEWTRLHGRAIYGAGPSDFDAPTDCRFTQRENRLYLHVFSWPFQHIHLEGFAGKVEYAQLLNDASEVKIREGDPHAVAQNTTSSGSEGELVLSLPIQKPDVLVPVIELFLK